MSSRLTPEVLQALVTSLDPQPRQPPDLGPNRNCPAPGHKGPSCVASEGRGPPTVPVGEAARGPEDGPGGIRGAAWPGPARAGWPALLLYEAPSPAALRSATPAAAVKRLCSPCTWPGVWHPDPRHHTDHEGPEAEGGRGGGELQGSWAAEA